MFVDLFPEFRVETKCLDSVLPIRFDATRGGGLFSSQFLHALLTAIMSSSPGTVFFVASMKLQNDNLAVFSFLFSVFFYQEPNVPPSDSHRHRGALLEVRVLVVSSCSYFG